MTFNEKDIKSQFERFFIQSDWRQFKLVAEYYLKKAAFIKNKDIDKEFVHQLLIRNIQKRLSIGIACELILKALYLKKGFCINFPKNSRRYNKFPYKFENVDKSDFRIDRTYSLYDLITNLGKIDNIISIKQIKIGLQTARIYRNKEGHVVTLFHDYNRKNYDDIEKALKYLYVECFNEKLQIKFSLEANEKAEFKITPL